MLTPHSYSMNTAAALSEGPGWRRFLWQQQQQFSRQWRPQGRVEQPHAGRGWTGIEMRPSLAHTTTRDCSTCRPP